MAMLLGLLLLVFGPVLLDGYFLWWLGLGFRFVIAGKVVFPCLPMLEYLLLPLSLLPGASCCY